jgi:hypothetical protein
VGLLAPLLAAAALLPSVSFAPLASVPARGGFTTVPGASAVVGTGPLRRFAVDVQSSLHVNRTAFADAVTRTLLDPRRGWTGAGGRLSLQRVDSGQIDIRVTLATPAMTDRLCAPLHTAGFADCFNKGRAVINIDRWTQGTVPYAGDLAGYRDYLVNHEVGHGLGHVHKHCPGPGRASFVMMQQTGTTFGCRRQPWPRASEQLAPLVPPRVLVLGTGDVAAAAGSFLRALGAPDDRLDVRAVPALVKRDLARAYAVVLVGAPRLSASRRRLLDRYASRGVGVITTGDAFSVCASQGGRRSFSTQQGATAEDWASPDTQQAVARGVAWVMSLSDSPPC